MRALLPLLLSVLTLACNSARLVREDVKAVAVTPVREWKTTALATGAVAATLLLDDEIASVARKNQSAALGDVFETVEPLGGGASDKVIAGFLLYGVAARDERARQVAFDAIVSHVIASRGITPAIKALVERQRPHGGEDDDSFPSNHSTQAFAVATVISEHYPRRWVRWTAYTLATGVGLARIYHDDHWATDVVAGAIIGTFVGRTVTRANERLRMAPIIDGKKRGVMVHLQRW